MMQPLPVSRRSRSVQSGYALIAVMCIATVALMTVAGALGWTSTSARLTERNNRYYRALAAAEAATEKVAAKLTKDYLNHGETTVYSSLSSYPDLVPSSSENSYWGGFSFSNGAGQAGTAHVSRTTTWGFRDLESQYAGLRGMASTYRIIANASENSGLTPVSAAVKQELQVALIPLFQFAIFYSMDLEINPGATMNITGRVHSNAQLYTSPNGVSLAYMDNVTAVKDINLNKSPLDPSNRSAGSVSFQKEHDAKVTSLNLPIGTNNTEAVVREVVEVPPVGESATSMMGKQRYYNKADLVISVNHGSVEARTGSFDSFSRTIPWTEISAWVNTNVSFYNKREGKTVQAVQIDVAALKIWSANTGNTFRGAANRDVSSIYIKDNRTQTSSTEPGIRLVNGSVLPPGGLTVATPQPLYVKGNYNANGASVSSTNTANTKPASLVGDAITILSNNWSDSNAGSSLSSRTASDTTVNAAFLAGIVKSDGYNYSGGVENFPRFLENWGSKKFWYNGSMVVMFTSKHATAPWGGSDVYGAPNRNWAFDVNFMDSTKLPPGTPQVSTVIRASWSAIAPNQIL